MEGRGAVTLIRPDALLYARPGSSPEAGGACKDRPNGSGGNFMAMEGPEGKSLIGYLRAGHVRCRSPGAQCASAPVSNHKLVRIQEGKNRGS